MSAEVRIPKLGMSAIEAEIANVFITVGQELAVGDAIADIESDKVTFTVEAEVSGTVSAVSIEVGQTYPVGHIICVVDPQ